MKQQTATPALAPHFEEIARAIRKKIDGTHEGWGTPSFVVRRACSRLATLAGTRRLTSHSATFRRAMAELQKKELPRASKRREVTNNVGAIARHLGIADVMPKPASKKLPPPKRIKGVRRIKVNGNYLEEHGVEFGDRLHVAMTGDVRPGELGYFEVHTEYHYGSGPNYCHRGFFFLFERGEDCHTESYYPQAGVCLRTFADRCDGHHVGSREEPTINDHSNYGILNSAYAFGRVAGVEREGEAVETALRVRPYDEREAVTTTLGPTAEPERPYKPKNGTAAGRHRLSELKRRLEEGDEGNDSTLWVTERMKVEKEIFDLEHPKDADWNDWSAWEKGGASCGESSD